jgi:hypothetical protein
MKVIAIVEKGGPNSYSCRLAEKIGNDLAIGYGTSAKDAMEDLETACKEMAELSGNHDLLVLEKEYHFDVGSAFNYYNFLNIEGFAKITGIKASVLRQYASGVRNPNKEKLKIIEESFHKAAEKIQSVVLSA